MKFLRWFLFFQISDPGSVLEIILNTPSYCVISYKSTEKNMIVFGGDFWPKKIKSFWYFCEKSDYFLPLLNF